MQIVMGSASELEYQVQLATDLGFLAPQDGTSLAPRIVDCEAHARGVHRQIAARLTD